MRFFFAIIFFLCACGGSTYNCGKIDRKYENNGKYFFALILNDASNNDEGRVYGDVSVEKSIYLLKKVGDDYCIED
ncbi:MAG: hypothetical protein CMC38_07940 [Flavobacteriaceae bacterium]|nr:hypothetical protein [Flavobacteriaceae bacterium]MAU64250.1 hypothetical protein [Flavobacteriaceae bacterium]|tara:strand:+ start:5035 stop:5262 length:228 start_codon:yes stop_codon:yes gene_type:complete